MTAGGGAHRWASSRSWPVNPVTRDFPYPDERRRVFTGHGLEAIARTLLERPRVGVHF
jgi:hypothetical protein